MSKVEVLLVNKLNPNITLEKGEFALQRGCLPLREIMNKWRIKNVVWLDGDLELDVTNDGLSDMAFTNMKTIRLVADKTGPGSSTIATADASADRHERAQQLVNHVVSNAKGKPVSSTVQSSQFEEVVEEQTTVLTFKPKPKQ